VEGTSLGKGKQSLGSGGEFEREKELKTRNRYREGNITKKKGGGQALSGGK